MTNLEKKVFLGKGICLSEEESTKAQLKIRNGIGLGVNGKHHIYIREECKGLLPDDDRYSCLIYEMNKVSSDEERINSYGKEYFFNLGDRFERKLKIGL